MVTQLPHIEPSALTVSNSMLLLYNDSMSELWKLDPSTGALSHVPSELVIQAMIDVEGTIFMIASDRQAYGNKNYELWKSDGIEGCTMRSR